MRAFEIHLNGKKLCLAGIGESGVLSAIVNWVARENVGDLFMEVGGLVTPVDEHVSWMRQKRLRVGDKIQIRVIEAISVDKPSRTKRPDPAQLLRARKLYVRKMAKEFGWEVKSSAKKLSS
jgi:hypothetical protein